jgi:hypothetical protein
MSSAGLAYVELTGNNYRYPTWIVVKPNGPRFQLTAYAPALPASGTVGATGVSGGRNGCDFDAKVMFGQFAYRFGACGAGAGWDTLLVQGQGFIRQGSSPLDFTSPDNSDCPPHTTGTCHVQEITDISFTVWPYPAMMVPVTAVPRTAPFNSVQYQQVVFTTGANPAKILVGGVLVTDTMTTTSWVYTAADGTLDGNMCSGGYAILVCRPYLHKSGRLVVKGWVGGWEQTSTVTVQCSVYGEPAFNDSTHDFSVREDLLDLLVTSNADSLPEAGWTPDHRRGSRHESGGVIWELPNNGGFVFVPYEDPNSTQGSYHLPDSLSSLSAAPVPGAMPYATVHTHPNAPNENVYGVPGTATLGNGTVVPWAQYPGDTLADGSQKPVPVKAKEDTLRAGSGADWGEVIRLGYSDFVVGTEGMVHRLDPPPPNLGALSVPTRYSGGTANQQKCSWVKKYKG